MLVYWPLNNYFGKDNSIAGNTEIYPQEEFNNIVERLDENSFFALLEDDNGTVTFSDEDLQAYVSANISDFEMYLETEKK